MEIKIGDNSFKDEGIAYITTGLKINKGLTKLVISNPLRNILHTNNIRASDHRR